MDMKVRFLGLSLTELIIKLRVIIILVIIRLQVTIFVIIFQLKPLVSHLLSRLILFIFI